MKTIRDLIFSSLGKIPAALETARQYLEMDNLYKSLKLHIEFSRLYKSILIVFRHILDWLSKSLIRKATSAFLKQGEYEKELVEKINIVRDRGAAVRQQAEICSQYLIGSIHQNLSKREEHPNSCNFQDSGIDWRRNCPPGRSEGHHRGGEGRCGKVGRRVDERSSPN
jgi:hypothetical protein